MTNLTRTVYPVRIIGRPAYPDYETARRTALKAEETSAVESDLEEVTRRKKTKPSRYVSSDEEDIVEPIATMR